MINSKKILFLLSTIFFSVNVYADTTNTPTITGFNYSGYLDENTTINVVGTSLNSCSAITVAGKKVGVISKSGSQISYRFGDNLVYSGEIGLDCSSDKIKSSFNFPHITEVNIIKNTDSTMNLNIKGSGFGQSPNIEISGSSFNKISAQDNDIVGKIDSNLSSTGVSVTAGTYKSNFMAIPIKMPKITHITSTGGFYEGGIVTIYGTNLNINNDFQIKFGNSNSYYQGNYDNNTKTIKFKLPEDVVGKNSLQIFSNGFLSNTIQIDIQTSRPEITNVEEKELISGTDTGKKLAINGKNFTKGLTKVYLNGNEVSIGEFTSENLLLINTYTLNYGVNTVEVENNGIKSPLYNYTQKTTQEKPSIYAYSLDKAKDGKIYITLSLQNFNKTTDKIYFNGGVITPESYSINSCVVAITDTTLIGEFSVGRGDYINPKKLKFDFSYQNYPIITSLSFPSGVGKSSKVEIRGLNFGNSTPTATNLFETLSGTSTPDIKITDTLITGYTSQQFNSSADSSFTLTNKGLKTTISFVGKNLGSTNAIAGAPLLKELKSSGKNGVFKAGVPVEVIGQNIRNGDILNIGESKVILSNTGTISFIFPNTSNLGDKVVYISNSSGQKSNEISISVDSSDSEGKIYIGNNSISKQKIYSQDLNSLSYPLYSLKISNRIKDTIIDKLAFKILNYSSGATYGSYTLKVNNTYIGTSVINSDGTIVFRDIRLDKNGNDIVVDLYKKSVYVEVSGYDITFDPTQTVLSDTDLTQKDIDYDKSFLINHVDISAKASNYCVDSESSNINCNSLVDNTSTVSRDNSSTISKPTQPIQNSTNTGVIDTNTTIFDDSSIKFENEIVIGDYNFKSSQFKALYEKFKILGVQLSSNPKYSDKLNEIGASLDNILYNLASFEEANNKNIKKAIVFKLKKDLVNLKNLIK